jgi:hypothetical protein
MNQTISDRVEKLSSENVNFYRAFGGLITSQWSNKNAALSYGLCHYYISLSLIVFPAVFIPPCVSLSGLDKTL